MMTLVALTFSIVFGMSLLLLPVALVVCAASPFILLYYIIKAIWR